MTDSQLVPATPAPAEYINPYAKANELFTATSDEQLGKMIRQRKEAQDFLSARGLY